MKIIFLTKKTVISVFLLFTSLLIHSQGSDPDDETPISISGYFDQMYDQYGNEISIEDLRIDKTVLNTNQLLPADDCVDYGYFVLHFGDGSGFEDSDPDNELRRNVACAVFSDLSNFITPGSPDVQVHIHVRDITELTMSTTTVGTARSFYYFPHPDLAPDASLILDNTVWQTINSGQDAYLNIINPIVATSYGEEDGVFYHGEMGINFNQPFNLDLETNTVDGFYDLYTVILHEVCHSLGFASLINFDGSSQLSNGIYNRYDTFLQEPNGNPLLTLPSVCNMTNFNGEAFEFNPAYVDNLAVVNDCSLSIEFNSGGQLYDVHTPLSFDTGNSLSHVADQCLQDEFGVNYTANTYSVMSWAIAPLADYQKRSFTEEDRNILCSLGYQVGTTFGSVDHLNNVTYIGGSCESSTIIAGIGDGLEDGVYQFVSTSGSPVIISEPGNTILDNDYCSSNAPSFIPTGFSCLEPVIGSGTIDLTSGDDLTTVTYTPDSDSFGVHLLRYVPIFGDVNGNVTYIFVFVTSDCPEPECLSLTSNSGFEEGSFICGSLVPGSILDGDFPCWRTYSGTADLYAAENVFCAFSSNYKIPTNDTQGNVFPYNGDLEFNRHWMSMGYSFYPSAGLLNSESVQCELNTPILSGESYYADFYINYLGDVSGVPFNTIPLVFAGSPESSLIAVDDFEITGLEFLTQVDISVVIPDDLTYGATGWQHVIVPFTYSGLEPLNTIIVAPDCNQLFPDETHYLRIYIDEFRLIPGVYVPIDVPTIIIPDDAVCLDEVWELTAVNSDGELYEGGIFWGIGVEEYLGTYYFNPELGMLEGEYTIYFQYDGLCDESEIVSAQIFVNYDLCCEQDQIINIIDSPTCGDGCYGQLEITDYDIDNTDVVYWTYPDGTVISVINPHDLCEGTYDLLVIYNDGCAFEESYTINNVPGDGAITFTEIDGDHCVECDQTLNLDALNFNDIESVEFFDPDGVVLYSGTEIPTDFSSLCSGTHHIVINYADGCFYQQYPSINDSYSENVCCNNEEEIYTDDFFYNSGDPDIFSGSDMYFEGNLEFASDIYIEINNANFRFNEGSSLIIQAGAVVTFNNCTFTSCTFWNGIDLETPVIGIEGYTSLTMNNSSLMYALEGIENYNYPTGEIIPTVVVFLKLNDVHFENNTRSIFFSHIRNFDSGTETNSQIATDCMFLLNDQYYIDDLGNNHFDPAETLHDPEEQIRYDNIIGFSFVGCDMENSRSDEVSGWSDRGYGIYTVDALFDFYGETQGSASIKGFEFGIYSSVEFGTFNGMQVYNCDFNQNKVSIVNNGICFQEIHHNDIVVGEATGLTVLDDEICNVDSDICHEGIYINGGGFFIITENNIFGQGANEPQTLGIRCRDIQTGDDLIHLNNLSYLTIGNLANGDNTAGSDPSQNGLRYTCNHNIDNEYDIVVSDFDGNTEVFIATYQNDVGIIDEPNFFASTGNIVTDPSYVNLNTDGHLLNEGANVITYRYFGTDEELINYDNSTLFLEQGLNDNQCIQLLYAIIDENNIYIDPIHDVVLDKAEYSYDEFQFSKFLWISLIDGGDTEELQEEIELAWTQDTWIMRDRLLDISPNVSEATLYSVADDTQLFPHPVALEIFLANPDVLRNNNFIDYLEHKTDPMPEYMITILWASRDIVTVRTILEEEMALSRTAYIQSMNLLLHAELKQDSIDDSLVMSMLDEMDDLLTEYVIIENYLSNGDAVNALLRIDELEDKINMKPTLKYDLLDYRIWLDLRIDMINNGLSYRELAQPEIVILYDLADNYTSTAGKKAMEVLNFYFDEEFYIPPALSGNYSVRNFLSSDELNVKYLDCYPNPANNVINLNFKLGDFDLEDGTLSIKDISGKTIYSKQIKHGNEYVTLDTRQWDSGLYIYSFTSKYITFSGKIEVIH